MLNVSNDNKVSIPENNTFKSIAKINTEKHYKYFNRILGITLLLVVLFMFLPWTQNIKGAGNVTALKPNQRAQTLQTLISGRIQKWYVNEGDFVKQGDPILSPLLVQHLGLAVAMFGAVLAERGGHLSSLGGGLPTARTPWLRSASGKIASGGAAGLLGMLGAASWRFVSSEMGGNRELAYGIPVWAVQALMPAGFLILAVRLGGRTGGQSFGPALRLILGLLLAGAGFALVRLFDGTNLPQVPFALGLVLILLAGPPIFAVLGGLALALFWSEGQPLASVPLSHYQITVNPSLPALPLFTLAGLV